jgi:Holliday junction resolvasome RuvABC endonuclease subunit
MINLNVLALDPATNCGWAHSSGQCGTWNLGAKRDESKGIRLVRLRRNLDLLKKELGVDAVCFESARNTRHRGALVVQSELQGVIKMWCEDNSVEYSGYSPTEIKKHACGKGTANKDQMIDAAKSKWPERLIRDDNTADACWLLDYVLETLYGR